MKATEEAQKLGTAKVTSIILLGALVKALGLEHYDWKAIISRKVPEKLVEMNLKAYETGLGLVH